VQSLPVGFPQALL